MFTKVSKSGICLFVELFVFGRTVGITVRIWPIISDMHEAKSQFLDKSV